MTDILMPNVTPISIESEMTTSFMAYAMSVIVSRALPDARDGLKPVHRRILFAQKGLSNHWNRPYLKCARVVGDVIGKYHPHGDTAVYDALVRMAQEFSMRYMLIDGQGNFGSIDGDPPAAMRYTECRMHRLSSDLMADLDKETVDWQLNYDDKEMEPKVLPTRVPNLLINGSSGIAVGMATNIPPHNMGEILDATLAVIADPEITADDLNKIVLGPDFPTGGIIQGRNGIRLAQQTGRGSVTVRGKVHFEEFKKDRTAIIVSEVPFMVNKANWIEKCAHLVRDKKLLGISDIRDESDRKGIRVVFELKRDSNEQVVLNSLYKMTQLQNNFSVNTLAIVQGRPERLTLRNMLDIFIDHRKEVVTRRTIYDLLVARERREIVEGLGLAVMQIDRVIEIIRSSKDTDEAKGRLIAEKMMGLEGFLERAGRPEEEVTKAREDGFVYLAPRQAQAILDMRLGRLTGLEREKLEAEYKDLWQQTDYLEGLLGDEGKLVACIIDEIHELRDNYADERRTQIVDSEGEILHEELIDVEEMVVTRTHLGYVKRTPVSEYQAQNRGGRGIKGAARAGDDDFVTDLFAASTHDFILLFTSYGRAYLKKVYELPAGSRTARGKPFVNVIDLQEGERVVGLLPIRGNSFEGRYVFMATRDGTVKKTDATAFDSIRSSGIRAIGINEGDRLVDVRLTDGEMDVMLATKNGQATRFGEDKVRPMGRDARGVRGINLREGDELIGMVAFAKDSTETLVTVCERGYGKRTKLSEFAAKNRGGKGMISVKCSSRNGNVTGVRLAGEDDHLIMISNKGKLIRMRAADISLVGRNTQGVRLMRLDEDELVASIERLAEPEEDSNIETVVVEGIDESESGDGESDDTASSDENSPISVADLNDGIPTPIEGSDDALTVPVDMSETIAKDAAENGDDDDDESED